MGFLGTHSNGKASKPIAMRYARTLIFVSDEQFQKASSPILATLLGIVILVIDEQSENALLLISQTPFWIVTSLSEEQLETCKPAHSSLLWKNNNLNRVKMRNIFCFWLK